MLRLRAHSSMPLTSSTYDQPPFSAILGVRKPGTIPGSGLTSMCSYAVPSSPGHSGEVAAVKARGFQRGVLDQASNRWIGCRAQIMTSSDQSVLNCLSRRARGPGGIEVDLIGEQHRVLVAQDAYCELRGRYSSTSWAGGQVDQFPPQKSTRPGIALGF